MGHPIGLPHGVLPAQCARSLGWLNVATQLEDSGSTGLRDSDGNNVARRLSMIGSHGPLMCPLAGACDADSLELWALHGAMNHSSNMLSKISLKRIEMST